TAARLLFFDDFEGGEYSQWTSVDYGDGWGNECQSNGFSTETAYSGAQSHRSEIVCGFHESHRGYGGVQFDGDTPLEAYTNVGNATEAPFGIVNTFWINLQTSYDFGDGRWLSLWTTNGDCGWNERVITLGLEDACRRILEPSKMADTRKDKRAPISLKVRFKSATLDEFIEQYSADISRGGIFIKSKSPMSVGTL